MQKYENGTNRLSASRLQQISRILRVPIQFFFEGVPASKRQPGVSGGPSPAYVSDFLATTDGLALVKAFVQIKDPALRRSIRHDSEADCRWRRLTYFSPRFHAAESSK